MATPAKPTVPRHLEDCLVVDDLLQTGAFGSVWRGRYKGHDVAVKVQRHHLQVLRNEAAAMKLVGAHKHVVNVLHAHVPRTTDDDGAHGILVMELCDTDLLDVVCQRHGLKAQQALVILHQITMAIAHCHARGVYHCDIKPDNVLISGRDTKLSDFGAAAGRGGGFSSSNLGSLPYLAPEVLNVRHEADYISIDVPAVDLWALGVTLFTSLTGRHPWCQASGRDVNYSRYSAGDLDLAAMVPEPVRRILMQLLTIDPTARPTAARLLEAEEFAALNPPAPTLQSPPPPESEAVSPQSSATAAGAATVPDAATPEAASPAVGSPTSDVCP